MSDFYSPYQPSNAGKFVNPVFMPASASIYPKTLNEAFYLCEYLYYLLPRYRQTQKRTVRYFITDIEHNDTDLATKNILDSTLKNIIDIFGAMTTVGDHWGCYGNAFVRLHIPYTRYFRKISSAKTAKFKEYTYSSFERYETDITYNSAEMIYEMPDPDTGYKTKARFSFRDVPSNDITKLKIIIENPKYFRINYNSISDASKFIYKFPPEISNAVKTNNIHIINTTPKSMLNAIGKDLDFLFNDDEIFHFKGPTINGLSKYGWGIPELIANIRQIFLIASYMKADEAIAQDFILPMRIFSMPQTNGGGSDGMQLMDSFDFSNQMTRLVQNQRTDPTTRQIAPFSFEYNEYCGNGRQYTPKELLSYQEESLNIGAGFTTDLFSASANIHIIPTALRLMQNTYYFIYSGFNKLLKWTSKKVQAFMNMKTTIVDLQMPKYADNLETMNIKLNLGQNGQLPYTTMYEPLGIKDPLNAIKQRIKEDLELEQERGKLEAEAQTKQQAQEILLAEAEAADGGAEAGGAAGAMGGSGILDKQQQAIIQAQQLLAIPDIGQRKKQMQMLEGADPLLYTLVKGNMETMRADMKSQGYKMMKEQGGMM